MVRIHPDPPGAGISQGPAGVARRRPSGGGATGCWRDNGAVAQLGERLLCKQEAVGSIPSSSNNAKAYAVRFPGERGASREAVGSVQVPSASSIDCVGRCLAVCLPDECKAKRGAVL